MDFPVTCFSINGGYIKLVQIGLDNFTVSYGMEVSDELNYVGASRVLGAAIMHHAACEGRLDSRDWDDEDTDDID